MHAFRLAVILIALTAVAAEESVWIEAEHLDGIEGYCWPMARGVGDSQKAMRTTQGHWGFSGPGWAAEWNQGGESGFLSIACGAEDDQAVATKTVEIPRAGTYHVWVRYRDNREATERFVIELEQPGRQAWSATYGETPVVEENAEPKLYWDGAFGWDSRPADLAAGPCTLRLKSAFAEPHCRQIDCLVLTTDTAYRPWGKERPRNYAWETLDAWARERPPGITGLVRRTVGSTPPEAWTPALFDGQFRYLWNVSLTEPDAAGPRPAGWLRGDADGIPHPWHSHGSVAEALRKAYAGRTDMPIFSDPRIVPVIHGAGPAGLGLDGAPPVQAEAARLFRQWLQADPQRRFAGLLNYAPNKPLSKEAKEAWFGGLDRRYLGAVAGESLGYFETDAQALKAATAQAKGRREVAQAMSLLFQEANRKKYEAVFGADTDKLGNPYGPVIPAQSVEGIAFYPLCFGWGARAVAHEPAAFTAGLLGMRTAFLRGAARQHGGRSGIYRSCNFGDSATIFSGETHWYAKPANIVDNFYTVYSGAGMTWYKFDIWYGYMAGHAFFYHEQGFDEFWLPGGLSAGGQWPVQLSPKGKLVDHFLRTTAPDKGFDRGVPYTPAAILVDYAHGWDPSGYKPGAWGALGPDVPACRRGIHDDAMQGLFWTAFHPIGPMSEKPMTALSEGFVHGVFGDIFDILYAWPQPEKWTTIDTYPLVVVAGDIELSEPEGRRLRFYMEQGGTLVVAADQLQGPGVKHVGLPEQGAPGEADGFAWGGTHYASQRFRYGAIKGGAPLAVTGTGDVLCAAFDVGKGRLVYQGIPYGLGIDRQPTPLTALLLAAATRGLMPVEVRGDVEWSLNRNRGGWMLTLINAAGQDKPQQGIFPTDYRQNRTVDVLVHGPATTAVDRLSPADQWAVKEGKLSVRVPAGSIRILEIK